MFNRVFNFNQNRSLKNGLPQMGSTLNGWEVPLTLVKVTQAVVDGDVVKTETPINFMGVWQPLRDEELQFKPENQRSWSWYWIHAKSGTVELQTQDKFLFKNKRYKVMAVKDYSLNGFIEYHVIRDYEDNYNG